MSEPQSESKQARTEQVKHNFQFLCGLECEYCVFFILNGIVPYRLVDVNW